MILRVFKPLLLLIGIIAFGAGLGAFGETSNCGGNSAALTAVGEYVAVAEWEAEDHPSHSFLVTAITLGRREMIQPLAGARWVRRAHFLVFAKPVVMDAKQPRWVVIVCDTPFTNVPQRRFGQSPPTHAAGFSDGSTALISPADFAALDRSASVALDSLYPAAARK